MEKIVGKIFLDDVSLVTTAHNKIIDAMVGIDFHDVPENWLTANLDHGLWLNCGFFTQTSTQTTG